MLKLGHNKALLLLLATAFLATQWATVHIHPAEHHDHNGDHHQHNIHAHEASSYHANSIYSEHDTDDYNIVEFDNDCTSPGWKKTGDQLAVSISVAYQFVFIAKPSNIQLSELDSNKQSYITYSTIRHRAPPQFS